GWLERHALSDDTDRPVPGMEAGRRAVQRCYREIRRRLGQFDEELADLRRVFYAPEVRAASLLFDQGAVAPHLRQPASRIAQPMSILVVLEPTAASVPSPQVADGRLAEPYITLPAGDRAALELALRLREQAGSAVTIQAVAIGPRDYNPVLREVLSLGLDRVRLVLSDREALSADCAARALAAVLGEGSSFDLVLGGMPTAADEGGLLARLRGEALGAGFAGRAMQVDAHKTQSEQEVLLSDLSGGRARVRALSATV